MKGGIDPHVHCRDGSQNYKETIAHVLKLAERQGVVKVFDMPNTDPPITYKCDVEKRLKFVPEGEEGRYFLYMGVTTNQQQLSEAVKCYDVFPEVVGLKMFAGSSTGNLLVAEEREQREVYLRLAEMSYVGVLAVHCEKESKMDNSAWDPYSPASHCFARPRQAEIASVNDQIKFALDAGFQGNLHICHVTCAEAVDAVNEAKGEMKITCGVTPHHARWDYDKIKKLPYPEGLIYKMNPPLRGCEDVQRLRMRLLGGKIDWIETDHAPHALGEKLHSEDPSKTPSGYPSLCMYAEFLNILRKKKMSEELIDAMTYHNIVKAFGHKVA